MKANELMMGDWVHITSPVKGRPEYDTQVYGVGPDVILAKKDSGANPVNLDRVTPVGLTAEILEKNGWDMDSCYSLLDINCCEWLEYYRHEGRLRKWWQGVDEWENHSKRRDLLFQCQCRNTHELQHALRLCGLTKLADNFKI